MPAHAIPYRKPYAYKTLLLVMMGILSAMIIGGSLYIQQTPAFSMRALLSDARRGMLTVILAPARATPVDQQNKALSIPVLTYHRLATGNDDISNVTKANFESQMIELKKAGWQSVSLKEFEEFMQGKRTLAEKSFMITFDDAAKDSYYPSDPVLAALDYQAVNFVIVAASEIPGTTYYLNDKEIKTMLESGRWSIGSHSYDGHHPYQTDSGNVGIFFADRLWLNDQARLETPDEFKARVQNDLLHAKESLETTYNVPIETFAFPLGNETGIAGANNFPEGASVTESVAESIYKFGFLQNNHQQFTSNFPLRSLSDAGISAETNKLLSSNFIVRRIHVDHDWDGARLLSILENSLPKQLPYEDDFSADRGWITSWGTSDIGTNNLALNASPTLTSASVMLDGSESWGDYSFDTTASWTSGHVFLLSDVTSANTYDACVFSQGEVRIQSSMNGVTTIHKDVKTPSIDFSNSARLGMRVHGNVIECTWNYGSVVEAYDRTHAGGIGIQTWDSSNGVAKLQVNSIIVRPWTASTTPQN